MATQALQSPPQQRLRTQLPAHPQSVSDRRVARAEDYDDAHKAENGQTVLMVALERIKLNPENRRLIRDDGSIGDYKQEDIDDLATNIEATGGIHHPILVQRTAKGWMIADGNSRWLAAKQAGLLEIPVIEITGTPEQIEDIAIASNLASASWGIEAQWQAVLYYKVDRGMKQREIAARIGKSEAWVSAMLRRQPGQALRNVYNPSEEVFIQQEWQSSELVDEPLTEEVGEKKQALRPQQRPQQKKRNYPSIIVSQLRQSDYHVPQAMEQDYKLLCNSLLKAFGYKPVFDMGDEQIT